MVANRDAWVEALNVLGADAQAWLSLSRRRVRAGLKPEVREHLATLESDGLCVVPGFVSPSQARELRARLTEWVRKGPDEVAKQGARMESLKRRQPGDMGDDGTIRIYKAQLLEPTLLDPYIKQDLPQKILDAYMGKGLHSAGLVFQLNPQGTKTRGYHIDGYQPELKTFLYLDDVKTGDGPFTYLRGTHKQWARRILRRLTDSSSAYPTSFSEEMVARWMDRKIEVTGGIGDLIIADVRGIHRGSPQISGDRAVIVNYLSTTSGAF